MCPPSYADVDVKTMDLTPMKMLWTPPGSSDQIDLGGSLDNVVITMAYKKADIKADQFGSTTLDRRVSGIEVKVTTSLAQIQDKNLFKVAFPHATEIPLVLTGVSVEADTPALATKTAHGLKAGQRIIFKTGTLPTGISLNTTYYVISAGLTANTFQFSATKNGPAVNGTGSDGTASMEVVGAGRIDWNSAIGDGDQANAGKLVCHPMSKPDDDVSCDYTFYKACSSAESEVTYGPETQGKMKVVWTILPDLDVTPPRFFSYGDVTLV